MIKSSSLIILIFKSWALIFFFGPMFSPAIKKVVWEDRDFETFPPCIFISFCILSLENFWNFPEITKFIPFSLLDFLISDPSLRFMPTFLKLFNNLIFSSSEKYFIILSAILSPTSSTCIIPSKSALIKLSIFLKWAVNFSAVVFPTGVPGAKIPSPYSSNISKITRSWFLMENP